MPDGKIFKKLNAVQYKALNNYYNRLHDKPISETLGVPLAIGVPIVLVGGMAAVAYIFKDEIQTAFKEEKEQFFTWLKGLPKKAVLGSGGAVADVLVSLGDLIFTEDPQTPPYILLNPEDSPRDFRYAGPLTRCQRWETDATTWLEKVQSGEYNTVQAALAAKRIISNMKKEGCSRPQAFTVAQWDN